MTPELIQINEDTLFDYLTEKNRPVMEYDLIKHFLHESSGNSDRHTLFIKHFSLYHSLYKLKFSAGVKGFYLHLDCMRIRLIRIPENGCCRHYDPVRGSFCGEKTETDFCRGHERIYRHSADSATLDILQDFYTDPENISFGDTEILKKLMNGIKVYCVRKKDIEEALKFFGIHKPGKKIITARYRELAGKYHPDRCGGSEEMMKKLNSFYMVLKEIYIL